MVIAYFYTLRADAYVVKKKSHLESVMILGPLCFVLEVT